jgi:hypothetical protein
VVGGDPGIQCGLNLIGLRLINPLADRLQIFRNTFFSYITRVDLSCQDTIAQSHSQARLKLSHLSHTTRPSNLSHPIQYVNSSQRLGELHYFKTKIYGSETEIPSFFQKILHCVYDLETLMVQPTKSEKLLAYGFQLSKFGSLEVCIVRTLKLQAPNIDLAICAPGSDRVSETMRLGFIQC